MKKILVGIAGALALSLCLSADADACGGRRARAVAVEGGDVSVAVAPAYPRYGYGVRRGYYGGYGGYGVRRWGGVGVGWGRHDYGRPGLGVGGWRGGRGIGRVGRVR